MSPNRRHFLKQAAFAALAGGAAGPALARRVFAEGEDSMPVQQPKSPDKPGKPNILFIFTDQMRADAMGCAGNPIVKTPHLDRLAREGAHFRNTYCQTPVCVPSRCSIFTGQYPHANGCKDNGMHWPTENHVPNMARELGKANYRTATVGKIHIEPDNFSLFGFDQRSVVFDKGFIFNDEYTQYLRERGLIEQFAHTREQRNEANIGATSTLSEEDYIDSFVGRKAVENIRSRCGASDDQPWFLWVGFPSPHVPTDPPAPWSEMYRPEDMPVPPFDPADYDRKPQTQKDQINLRRFYSRGNDPAVIRRFLAHYYGLVSMLDMWVGKLIDTLTETGQIDNTLVVFGSDHGDFAGDHGTLFKSFALYEGLVRVPMIFWQPGVIAPQGPIDAYAENVDFLPTFLEAAGAENTWGAQGRSLFPIMRGQSESVRDFLFSEYHYQKAIRKDRWKLIHYAGRPGEGELYDLAADPHEAYNLYESGEHRAVRNELEAMLLDHLIATETPGNPYESNFANAVSFLREPGRGSV